MLHDNQVSYLGSVEIYQISFPSVIPCQPLLNGQSPSTIIDGETDGLVGYAAAPIQNNWTAPFNLWSGPHAMQAWPLVGTFPGALPGELGAFTPEEIGGTWLRPYTEGIQVNGVTFSLNSSIDAALPQTTAIGASWSSQFPISPIAKVTDQASLAVLQNSQALAAVGIGIGGSLLASLLFELMRPEPPELPGPEHDEPVPTGPQPEPPEPPRPEHDEPVPTGTKASRVWCRRFGDQGRRTLYGL